MASRSARSSRGRTEQNLQIYDQVDERSYGRAEQAQRAERVQPRGHEMGAVKGLDEDRALVQPGEPGALPHTGSGMCHQLMGRTEVDHELGVAVREQALSKRVEASLDFPVFLDDPDQCSIRRRAGKPPPPWRCLVFERLNRSGHAETYPGEIGLCCPCCAVLDLGILGWRPTSACSRRRFGSKERRTVRGLRSRRS